MTSASTAIASTPARTMSGCNSIRRYESTAQARDEAMFDRRSWMMGVGCALALLAPSRVVGADGDQMFATVATPAIITVKARAAIERLGSLVVIVVTGFEPP